MKRILPLVAALPFAACAPAAAPVSTPGAAMAADTPRAQISIIAEQPALGTPNPYRLPPVDEFRLDNTGAIRLRPAQP